MRKRVLVGLSKEGNTWGATALDYPGCVAVGDSAEEVKEMIAKALEMHIRGMIEDGEELPEDVDDHVVVDVAINMEPIAVGR